MLANPNRTQGVQCRTMLSQRPCRNPQCTREECSGARLSAQVFMDGTKDSTENGSMPSESAPQGEGDTEPTYTLQGLSARDVERIEHALRMSRRIYTLNSPEWVEISRLGARVSACKEQ